MNIQTMPVERQYVTAEVRMVGKVDYDETRLRHITAWVADRLDRLYVDYVGVMVNEGDHLVYLSGQRNCRPGKRPDLGDVDYLDPYYHGTLYNDGSLGDYNHLRGYPEFHGDVGRQRDWRSQSHIPLRYDDFRQYQKFRYDPGWVAITSTRAP